MGRGGVIPLRLGVLFIAFTSIVDARPRESQGGNTKIICFICIVMISVLMLQEENSNIQIFHLFY